MRLTVMDPLYKGGGNTAFPLPLLDLIGNSFYSQMKCYPEV